MSRTGQSRPFHRGADGLVPAEGAAIVTLKRLSDALSAGDNVLGVIRGVGLSNDGRGRGLLAPRRRARRRAMRLAYAHVGAHARRTSRSSSATPPGRPSATPPRCAPPRRSSRAFATCPSARSSPTSAT